MTRDDAERIVTDVVCGFCGLGCDDLEVRAHGRRITPLRACPEATRLLARGDDAPPLPRVAGRPASLAEAASAAAELLAGSRAAAFAGLGADVEGLRRLYDLATAAGASLDHSASGGLFANLEQVQRRGWIAATLAEVRNRCDVMVVLGADPTPTFRHFFDRAVPAPRAGSADAAPLFVERPAARLVAVVGGPLSAEARAALGHVTLVEVPLAEGDIAAAAALLANLVAGRAAPPVAEGLGMAGPALADLAGRLGAARYAVFVWNAGSLPAGDAAAVAEAAAGAVAALSVTTRAAVFPLGGRDNGIGAHQLSLWRFGYPLRTQVGAGGARHVPALYATAAALEDADLLLHVNAFRPEAPPPFGRGPVIALAHPGTAFEREPDVVIPVGTPGVDHAGHVFRMDNVVCLPLAALRPAELPSVAEAVDAIRTAGRRA